MLGAIRRTSGFSLLPGGTSGEGEEWGKIREVGKCGKGGEREKRKRRGMGGRKGGMLPVIIEGRVDKKLVLCPIHLMFMFVF